MIWTTLIDSIKHATPTHRRMAIVFPHKDIELGLLADKVRDRLINWPVAWQALDESMPYDLPRPRCTAESISVDSLFKLVARSVPPNERNAILSRLSGKLAYLKLGPWEVMDFIAEEHFVEKEREE